VLTLADRLMEKPPEVATVIDPDENVAVTIGIATYDDFDGAWFTINSLHLHHQEVMDRAEVVLLDNHPRGPESAELKRLDQQLPRVRYIPVSAYSSTAIRDHIFAHARAPLVVVLDSHVLLAPGSLQRLVDYFESNPESLDIVHGPMLAPDNRHVSTTQMDPVWNAGMYGVWGHDERGDDPAGDAFEIPMQGLAAFACRREAWPGLNPKFVGFGGEEGYLHEKIRRAGGRAMCLPAFRWQHRFPRPKGISYRLNWEDRVRNYAIGWSELGFDIDEIAEHFVEATNTVSAPEIVARVRRGIATEFWKADGVLCINDDLRPGRWNATTAAFHDLGIIPLRVPRRDDGPHGGSVQGDLEQARTFLQELGWRSAIVVGEEAADSVAGVRAAEALLRAGGSALESRGGLVTRIDVSHSDGAVR
jgi:hypothetical protein